MTRQTWNARSVSAVPGVAGGTLTLTGNNTYTGGTTLNAGTLNIGSNSTLDLAFNNEGGNFGAIDGAAVTLDSLTRGSAALINFDVSDGTITLSSGSIGRRKGECSAACVTSLSKSLLIARAARLALLAICYHVVVAAEGYTSLADRGWS